AQLLVDVFSRDGARRLQPLGDLFQAFDLEAEVVDAAPARSPLDSGDRIVLEVQDRQIDVTVAQVVAPGGRAVELRDLLHAEHVDVELRGLVHVLGREGDVLDLRHGVSPVAMVRIGLFCLSRQVTPERADLPGQSPPALRRVKWSRKFYRNVLQLTGIGASSVAVAKDAG